ncbi:MscL family protein [Candidatus Saccharibacteria bacterium]|nr:MscL family protein [Candidatus Saccharibacteria bacterium]
MTGKTTHRKQSAIGTLDEPDDVVRKQVDGFIHFIREKAVVGLAIGFIIGQQAQGFIKQLVDSFLTPVINALVGSNLQERKFALVPGSAETNILWGKFVYIAINFLLVLFAIYVIIKLFKLDKLDLPKEAKKKK